VHAVVYRVADSRGAEAARELLKGFQGVVMTNGYAVYQAVANASGGRLKVAHCWSHVRRKFRECHASEAQVALELIGELYQVEREYRAGVPDLRRLHELRQQKSRAVIAQLHEWALSVRALPESALGKALGSPGLPARRSPRGATGAGLGASPRLQARLLGPCSARATAQLSGKCRR
jgi:transposase